MEIQNPKGTRDYLPFEQILKQEISDKLRKVFESFGFNPIDTPALEKWELIASKDAGEEILKETFSLTDQGNRRLGLRFDLTLPLARLIAMHPELELPFRRYHIGKVWRDGPVNLGRYREFMQCDVDIIGCQTNESDAELISIIQQVFKKFDLKIIIKVNSIKILHGIIHSAHIEHSDSVILSLDKLEKIGEKGVRDELKEKIEESKIDALFEILNSSKGSNEDKLDALKLTTESGQEGLREIKEILSLCDSSNVVFEPSLARGLSYYTGMIIETFIVNSEIKSSVCSGGRYDKLIGKLSGRDISALGISFGLDRIYDSMSKTQKKSVSQILFVPIGINGTQMAQELRSHGLNVELSLEKGVSKNLKHANSLGIPYVALFGKAELEMKKVKLRDMTSGEEEFLSIAQIAAKLKLN